MGDLWHKGNEVLGALYVEANAYCANKHMSVEKVSEETHDGRVFVSNASANLRFRCVPSRPRASASYSR